MSDGTRRLGAILAADVADCSRLIGEDAAAADFGSGSDSVSADLGQRRRLPEVERTSRPGKPT